jgi:Leucine-rich repeat (LRR) protein
MVFIKSLSILLIYSNHKGRIKNIPPGIYEMRHLTALFLGNNQLQRIPPEIAQLRNLTTLDLSHNKLRSLPAEIGEMVSFYFNQCQIKFISKIEFALSSLPKFKSIARPSLRTWTIVSATNIWFLIYFMNVFVFYSI